MATNSPNTSHHTINKTKLGFCITACLLILLGSFFILATKRTQAIFGNITFDQILFHIQMPTGTINPDLLKRFTTIKGHPFIEIALLLVFVYCLSVIAMLHRYIYTGLQSFFSFIAQLRHMPKWLSKVFMRFAKQPFIVPLLFSLLILIVGICFASYTFKIFQSITSPLHKSTLIDEMYVENKLDNFKQIDDAGHDLEQKEKPNLIIILSESLESTFADPSLFDKNLIRDLTAIQNSENSINDLITVHGCQYTIAAMYALYYGLPLLYLQCNLGDPLQKNIFQKHCLSIFDVLHSSGYQISHLQGASLKFASKDKLFEHIPDANILGCDEISKDKYPNRQGWGLYDSDLFDAAKSELLELNKQEKPFALSLQTVDTHFENTLQPGQPSEYGDIRDIIVLQSKLIANFVTWIQNQSFGENTVIVILGDHNMMTPSIGGIMLPRKKRKIFNCIINSKAGKAMGNRKASMFDFAPTVLVAMRFDWPSHALGIGRSLYHDNQTCLEKYGLKQYNEESKKRSNKYIDLIK